MWVVYDSPTDYPCQYVARRFVVVAGKEDPVITQDMRVSGSLDGVRRQIPPGLFRMPRFSNDDPCVVEVWF